jgi:hypothetical protein
MRSGNCEIIRYLMTDKELMSLAAITKRKTKINFTAFFKECDDGSLVHTKSI